jgi:hypothetical protein
MPSEWVIQAGVPVGVKLQKKVLRRSFLRYEMGFTRNQLAQLEISAGTFVWQFFVRMNFHFLLTTPVTQNCLGEPFLMLSNKNLIKTYNNRCDCQRCF